MAYDDIVVGAGHNGLTAAAYLARAGRRVLVLERLGHAGGAAVSAHVFEGVDVRLSRYAYLVSLLPRRIITDLDLDLTFRHRRYSSYTPDPKDPGWGLLVDTADDAATGRAFRALTLGEQEYAGWRAFHARIGRLAARVWPTLLEPLRSTEEVRALVDDEALWAALTQVPLGSLLWEYFRDDVVRGIVATDGLIGTFASVYSEELAQNVCFLYHVIGGGTGDWDVPVGGMGAVTAALAGAATRAGAELRTGTEVLSLDPSGRVSWREGGSVRSARAGSVVAACAPAVLDRLLGSAGAAPVTEGEAPEGSQLKVNLLLRRLPRLKDPAVDPAAAFAGTFHVNESLTQLEAAYAAASAGRMPVPVPCEVYCHTLSDRSILGPGLAGTDAQTLTVFALHLPARLFRADNARRTVEALGATLRSLDSVLGEPVEPLLLTDPTGRPCIEAHSPVDLQARLGLPGGHIFHRPLRWPWAQRPDEVGTWGVETRYAAVTLGGAGARRGGGVSGIPGHNAAMAVLGS
ncbi:MAG: phytoene desaturase family protein [Dermatophilaceae bacterium]